MNMEEIENYISELESMFELSELEEHSRNILKVGIYIKQLQQENQKLKKELEEKNKPQIFIDTQDIEERYAEGLYQDYLEEENKKYKNQQKEFINYLENMLDDENDIFSVVRVKDALRKYREIMGVER